MSAFCDNCGKKLNTKMEINGLDLCVECGYKIQALKAEKDYWDAKKQETACINMNKQSLDLRLKQYFEGQFPQEIKNYSFLLEVEKNYLLKDETNWQSYVLSFLYESGIIGEQSLLVRHWVVTGLVESKATYAHFCEKEDDWTNDSSYCRKTQCWKNDQTEFDAVLKDRNGNWKAVFEYEDDYNSCCQELCNMTKLFQWLKTNKSEIPLFCLFYWLPTDKTNGESSMESLVKWYIPFVKKEMKGIEFLLVVLTGGNEPKRYSIEDALVVDDLDNAEANIKKKFNLDW